MNGKMGILYVPVKDIKRALAFYRDQLGLDEDWREGDGTIVFKLPTSDVVLMIDRIEEDETYSTGPGFIIPSVDEFYAAEQNTMEFVRKPADIPPGRWATAKDPSGNMLYFFDFSKQM